MAIEKLNMKFVPEQILQDEDMTKIVNKVDEVVDKVNELDSSISEVYPNYDAIISSGETNTNKIYIDGATNTSYRYDGVGFVSIGGGSKDNYEECEGIYSENSFKVSISKNELDYINSLDCISVMYFSRNQEVSSGDWYRYLGLIYNFRSDNSRVLSLNFDGKIRVFGQILDYNITSYKNIIAIDRASGIVVAYNEIGKFVETQLEALKTEFLEDKQYIEIYSGDRKNAFLDYVLFNFNVDNILRFNTELLSYLRNAKKTGILPSNIIYEDNFPIIDIFDKYTPDSYKNNWEGKDIDENGYTIISTNTTDNVRCLGYDGDSKYRYKACRTEVTFEILEGSIKIINLASNTLVVSDNSFYKLINTLTNEEKQLNEELSVGTWTLISDYWNNTTYTQEIKSIQVPVRIKCITQKNIPYTALIQIRGDRFYDNKIYDTISKSFREVTTPSPLKKGSVPFDASEFKSTNPSRAPRFIGEKWYNTDTGDIYEAGDLTSFKKLNS